MSETEINKETDNSLAGNAVECPRCTATRVAKSRLRGLDGVRMQLLPMRPYRCLHCYHRFWVKEPFALEKQRVWTWSVIIFVLIGLMLLLYVRSVQRENWSQRQVEAPSQQTQTRGEEQVSAPESVIEPLIEIPPATAINNEEELAAVSDRLKEYGWYVTAAGDEQNANTDQNQAEPNTESSAGRAVPVETVVNDVEVPASVQAVDPNDVEIAPEELESLLKVTIARHMKRWRNAWQAGDIEAYLANYSDGFIPANSSYMQWRTLRMQRVTPDKKIQLELSNFQVSFDENYQKVNVVFDQNYRSKNYVDTSRKRLVWTKVNEDWKIASEREIE